jgi:hypothetical protein
MNCPYKIPEYRPIWHRYQVRYAVVDHTRWWNVKTFKTETIEARNLDNVWDQLYWKEWQNCYRISEIDYLGPVEVS